MNSSTRSIVASLILSIVTVSLTTADDCVPRDFGYGSIVCVCNSTYCDSTARHVPEFGQYSIYESSQSGTRMSERIGHFEDVRHNENATIVTLNVEERFQMIHGFGGAFTDSAGINIMRLSRGCQERILETYFGPDGSQYSLCRVPAGGTDFSIRAYTYEDVPDPTLAQFSLAPEDYMYKIPLMQRALELNPSLNFFSAAWSAPPWMKTNNHISGFGFLRPEYYQVYADYLLRFLIEYRQHGLNMWAISTGNEPLDAWIPLSSLNTMGWTPETVANWIANNLGPTIAASESNYTYILIIDDQRINVPWYADAIFQNELAKNYTTGIALHWYLDDFVPPETLDETHNHNPTKFLLQTEACVGSAFWEYPSVRLGDWMRGEQYMSDIIETLNHWMVGWVDWNLALDKTGGPNWIANYVDSPIIVNPETDEFFKQPTYYAIAHFSKFIPRRSQRIGVTTRSDVRNVAFLTPGNEIVVVLFNPTAETMSIVVTDPERGNISTDVVPHSIQTIIYTRQEPVERISISVPLNDEMTRTAAITTFDDTNILPYLPAQHRISCTISNIIL